MTRPMPGHKISDDGNTIVCTAPANAWCRTRPECDTEWWDKDGCEEHAGEHPLTTGHDCWAIEWINAPRDTEMWECADDWAATSDLPIIPGRAVVLTGHGDNGFTWAYVSGDYHDRRSAIDAEATLRTIWENVDDLGFTAALNAERSIHQARAEQMADTIARNQE